MKKRKTLRLAVVALLVTTLTLTGCGSSTSSTPGVLNLATEAPPNSLNSTRSSETANSSIIGQYLEGLVEPNEVGEISPIIAEKWVINEEGDVYTFTLRDNVVWSNGDPVTANDFVFAWKQLATDKQAAYGYMAETIKNGKAIRDGEKDVNELAVKAVDDKTLEVTLEQPTAYFIQLVGFAPFYPINEKFFNEIGGAEKYGTSVDTVLANGPFVLSKYAPDEGWSFTKNEKYWNAAEVKLNEVNVRFVAEKATQISLYESGEVDRVALSGEYVDQYASSSEKVVQNEIPIYYFYLSGTTNTPDEVLANKNFRAAVAHSIDKTIIADNILKNGSLPIDYVVPTNFGSLEGKSFREYANQYNTLMFNTDTAKEYLEKAKSELNKDTLEFTITVSDTELSKKIYENVESQIETNLPGVNVTIQQIPSQAYYPEVQKLGTPSGSAGWSADYIDPSSYFEIFRSQDSHNYGKWNNAEFDKLFNEANSADLATKPAERWTKFAQAEKLLLDDYAIVPLYQRASTAVVKPNVKGFKLYPSSSEVRYKYVSVD